MVTMTTSCKKNKQNRAELMMVPKDKARLRIRYCQTVAVSASTRAPRTRESIALTHSTPSNVVGTGVRKRGGECRSRRMRIRHTEIGVVDGERS
ncbi:hypothetical protein KQX54_017909 [Cotesia glomerata]|uniref:Uncharacterized protein n=1 Tax=Cotesia glomerata TaxID=32391 RepID=A0AAV7IY02_COTGL|nr:hypothetical protein KQX54_017909 [Cotesia glomerata]